MKEQSVHKNFLFQIGTMALIAGVLGLVVPEKEHFQIPQASAQVAEKKDYSYKDRARQPASVQPSSLEAQTAGLGHQTLLEKH